MDADVAKDLPFLHVLGGLPTAVWVFDLRVKAVVWGNTTALKLWNTADQDELRALDFSYLSETDIKTYENYSQQYERELKTDARAVSHHTEVWTLYPKGMTVPINLSLLHTHTAHARTITCPKTLTILVHTHSCK
jgi:hypothetical protein